MKDTNDELYFQFGSRNSGFMGNGNDRGELVATKKDRKRVMDFLSSPEQDLIDLWWAKHLENVFDFSKSGYRSGHVISMLVTIERAHVFAAPSTSGVQA